MRNPHGFIDAADREHMEVCDSVNGPIVRPRYRIQRLYVNSSSVSGHFIRSVSRFYIGKNIAISTFNVQSRAGSISTDTEVARSVEAHTLGQIGNKRDIAAPPYRTPRCDTKLSRIDFHLH